LGWTCSDCGLCWGKHISEKHSEWQNRWWVLPYRTSHLQNHNLAAYLPIMVKALILLSKIRIIIKRMWNSIC